jgi:hypothetical protein
MTSISLNSNPIVTQTITAHQQMEKIREIAQIKNEQTQQNFPRKTVAPIIDRFVTEKLDEQIPDARNDLRLYENTPIAKLLQTIKQFNDVNKKKNANSSVNEELRGQNEVLEEDAEIDESKPIGFYIVLNNEKKNTSLKLLTGKVDIWKERLEKTYRTKIFRDNGSLVNLTI